VKKVYYICLALLFCACEKENPIDGSSECKELKGTKSPIGYTYKGPEYSFYYPFYNPKNSNEFLFVKAFQDKTELWVKNIQTDESMLVHSGEVHFMPKWSSSGWIVFNKYTKLWKIKANGDSLREVTSASGYYYPAWSPGGTYLVSRYIQTDRSWPKARILTNEGQYVKDLDSMYGYIHGSWSPDSLKLGGMARGGIGYLDILTEKQYISAKGDGNIDYGCSWFPDSKRIAYCNERGLFVTNVETGETKQLRVSCNSRQYIFPSVSPDGSKILVGRTDSEEREKRTVLYVQSNIHIMNVDGTSEERISL
jgi:Tol biopolymer transport system component